MNFTNERSASPSKSLDMEDYDLQPVKEEKRKIVNQPVLQQQLSEQSMPGVIHIKDEATR